MPGGPTTRFETYQQTFTPAAETLRMVASSGKRLSRLPRQLAFQQPAGVAPLLISRLQQAFQFRKCGQILLPAGGAFGTNQSGQIQSQDCSAERLHRDRLSSRLIEPPETRNLGQQIELTDIRPQSQHRCIQERALIPDKRKFAGKTPQPRMEWRKGQRQPAKIFGRSGVADIEIERDVTAAVEHAGNSANHNKLHPRIRQNLNRPRKLHQARLRAIPRICSIAMAARSSFCARSPGVSRSCSTSSVR